MKTNFFHRLTGLLREAIKATFAAKTKTLMSAICIGIGIAGVTLVTALGVAAISKTTELMELYGTDALFIISGGTKKRAAGMRQITLDNGDLQGLKDNFPDAYVTMPLRSRGGLLASYENAQLVTEVQSVTSSMNLEWGWQTAEGRDFVEEDMLYVSNVCIIGATTAERLFDYVSPIGKQIQVGKSVCEVIGVSQAKSFGAMDDEANNFVAIPDSVFLKKFAWRRDLMFAIRMRFYNAASVDAQAESVRQYLRQNHHLNDGDEDDFQIMTASSVSAMIFKILGAIGAFLGIITLVVVVVGGFVTANMFLLSTQSRVKEIGIRRAFGATAGDIFNQFILEFILITLFGAFLGLLIAQFTAQFISSFGFLEIVITPTVFIITALVSAAIALIFGILPAKSASKVSPIEAMRTA